MTYSKTYDIGWVIKHKGKSLYWESTQYKCTSCPNWHGDCGWQSRIADETVFKDITRLLDECSRNLEAGTYKILEYTHVFEEIDVDSDEMIAKRQKIALSKLSTHDIEALGIEELAILHKLSDTQED